MAVETFCFWGARACTQTVLIISALFKWNIESIFLFEPMESILSECSGNNENILQFLYIRRVVFSSRLCSYIVQSYLQLYVLNVVVKAEA
jgi:hypothetical protein